MRVVLACCVSVCATASPFSTLDTHGDGFISPSEFEHAEQELETTIPERDALRQRSAASEPSEVLETTRAEHDALRQLLASNKSSEAGIVGTPARSPPKTEGPMRGGEHPLKTHHRQPPRRWPTADWPAVDEGQAATLHSTASCGRCVARMKEVVSKPGRVHPMACFWNNMSAPIQANLSDDFLILQPILASRGYDVSKAMHICEFPSEIMKCYRDGTYSLILEIPAEFVDLKRIDYLKIRVITGRAPPGIERLRLAVPGTFYGMSVVGTVTGGWEGPLPRGFWGFRGVGLSIKDMGPQFTGGFDEYLSCCETSMYAFELQNAPSFFRIVAALRSCKH